MAFFVIFYIFDKTVDPSQCYPYSAFYKMLHYEHCPDRATGINGSCTFNTENVEIKQIITD